MSASSKPVSRTLIALRATKLLEKNHGDIAKVATILGHANISATTRYLPLNVQRIQEIIEEI